MELRDRRVIWRIFAAADALILNAADVLIKVGELRAFDFTRRVAYVAAAQIFDNIRKSNGLDGFPIKGEDGILRPSQNLEDFCRHYLGKSYRRCVELAQNLPTLGTDLTAAFPLAAFSLKL